MSYSVVQGNLLRQGDKEPILVHQTNCESKATDEPKGIAFSIEKDFPYAAPYKHRKNGVSDSPGSIRLYQDPSGHGPTFIGLNAQLHRGAVKRGETQAQRFKLFEQALDEIVKLDPMPSRLAFPYRIGCGLAGGHWPDYERALKDFAERSGIELRVYKDDSIESQPQWNRSAR